MRIAIFTDVHHNDENIARRHCVSAIPSLREKFAHFAAPGQRPDMMITLGDLIMARRGGTPSERVKADASRLGEILHCFASSGVDRVYHIHGNHEDKNLTRTQVGLVASRTRSAYGSRHIELEGLSIILWSPDVRIVKEKNGASPVSGAELDWLKTTLDRVTNPAIVMTHLPLDGDLTDFTKSMIDGRPNPVFGKKPPGQYPVPFATHYPNAPEIRKIIADSGRVMACLAGHTHWNEARVVNNVAYITIPSLVENAEGQPHRGWAMMHINPKTSVVQIDVLGASPCNYQIQSAKPRNIVEIQRHLPF